MPHYAAFSSWSDAKCQKSHLHSLLLDLRAVWQQKSAAKMLKMRLTHRWRASGRLFRLFWD